MLKVFIQGFRWDGIGNDLSKVSFLNKDVTPVPITDRVDLASYLMEPVIIERANEENEQYPTGIYKDLLSSNTVLVFDGTEPFQGSNLQAFFMIQQDTRYVKYKVEIYKYGKLRFIGSIGDQIECPINTTNASGNITAISVGYDKEGKDYYSSVKLRDFASIPGVTNTQYNITYEGENGSNPQVLKRITLQTFLTWIFDANFFIEIEDSAKGWQLMERPHFVKFNAASKLVWFKSGYRSAQRKGENVFGYVKKLFNAMGWQMNFFPKNNVPAIFVSNRISITGNVLEISDDDIIGDPGIVMQKISPSIKPVLIVMFDGKILSANEGIFFDKRSRSNRCIVISNFRREILESGGLNDVIWEADRYRIPASAYIDYGQIIQNSNERFEYAVSRLEYVNSTSANFISESYLAESYDCLFLDVGSHTDLGMQIDRINKKHFDNDDESTINNTSTLFTGCYANALFREPSGINGYLNTINFQDHIKTNLWRRNFTPSLFGSKNIMTELIYDGLLDTPFTTAKFVNGMYPGMTFAITKMTEDTETDETTLTLNAVD